MDGDWISTVVKLDYTVRWPIFPLKSSDHHVSDLLNAFRVINLIHEIEVRRSFEIVHHVWLLRLEHFWGNTHVDRVLDHLVLAKDHVPYTFLYQDRLLLLLGLSSFQGLFHILVMLFIVAECDGVEGILLFVVEHYTHLFEPCVSFVDVVHRAHKTSQSWGSRAFRNHFQSGVLLCSEVLDLFWELDAFKFELDWSKNNLDYKPFDTRSSHEIIFDTGWFNWFLDCHFSRVLFVSCQSFPARFWASIFLHLLFVLNLQNERRSSSTFFLLKKYGKHIVFDHQRW